MTAAPLLDRQMVRARLDGVSPGRTYGRLTRLVGLEAEARAIEAAVSAAIDEGCHTGDLGAAKPINTTQMGDAVRARLKR